VAEVFIGAEGFEGGTRGYKNHLELKKFKNHLDPQRAVANYLIEVWKESSR